MSRSPPDEARTHPITAGAIAFVLISAAAPVLAGSVWLPGAGAANTNVSQHSVQERKFATVVRQQYDFSCGSAALATLLTYHYEDRTDEQTAFRAMYDKGDKAKIVRAGFSLLDMKNYLEGNGYQADGYDASLAKLTQAGVPAIALINYRGYRHFVVVKGVTDRDVLIGDPALGLRFIPRNEFDGMWDNHILFIIKNRSEVGQKHFNPPADWNSLARAPLGSAVSRDSLASATIALPRLGDF